MPNFTHILLVPVAAIGLSACQKSACDGSLSNNRAKAADQLVTCLDSLEVTTNAEMPKSGQAVYNGLLVAEVDTVGGLDGMVADARITANFGAGTLSGTAKNFESDLIGPVSGQLAITAGTITSNIYSANIGGNLGYGGSTMTVSGTSTGTFAGDEAQMIVGDVTGTATVGGFVGGVSGGILAKK